MSGLDIKCYRVNYSREWLNGKHDTKLFPVDGAIDAIHALCDALEKKDRLIVLWKAFGDYIDRGLNEEAYMMRKQIEEAEQ